MKKRVVSIAIIFCLVFASTAVYAANAKKIEAALSSMKLYLNNKPVKGDVITAKGNTFIPISVLSNDLGLKVSTNAKAGTISISGKVGSADNSANDKLKKENNQIKSEKAALQQQVAYLKNSQSQLLADNGRMKSQINELNSKLAAYSNVAQSTTNNQTPGSQGGSGISEDQYFKSLALATTMSSAVAPLKKNQFIKTYRDNKTDTYYKVDLKEGEGLTAVLKPQIDKDYMQMYLCNESGSQLSYSGGIYNGKYGLVSGKATHNTTVYIRVTGITGVYYLGFYDHYNNNLPSLNDERDFFGSLNTAKKITNEVITRNDSNLEEYYRVDVKEGQTLSVSISAQIDKNYLQMYLYDAEGSQLSYSGGIYNGKTGTISKKASKDCTYFVKINGSTGKYNLAYSVN